MIPASTNKNTLIILFTLGFLTWMGILPWWAWFFLMPMFFSRAGFGYGAYHCESKKKSKNDSRPRRKNGPRRDEFETVDGETLLIVDAPGVSRPEDYQ